MCGIAISIDEPVIRISVTDTDLNVATGVTLMLVVIIIYMLSRWQGLITFKEVLLFSVYGILFSRNYLIHFNPDCI